MMRSFVLVAALAVFGVCFSSHAALALTEKQLSQAESYIDALADDAIGFLADKNLSKEERTEKFRVFLNDKFDMDYIGRFAMGRNWRTATDAQKKTYLKVFNRRIIDVYSRRFEEYKGQDLSIVSSRAEGTKDAIVLTLMSQPSGPDVRLDWRVRHDGKRYRVIDVIVEGVSMAMTQRSDFASVIQRGGGDIDVLLDHLKEFQ